MGNGASKGHNYPRLPADYESKAAVVMTDVYRKRIFREQMRRAIRDRQIVLNAISSYALYLRLRKIWICYTTSQMMAEKAYAVARNKIEKT